MKKLIDVASGRVKADVVIKNATVADVFGGRFVKGDVAICGDRIAGVGRYEGAVEIDGTGKYVAPSFYDAHLHFESVMIRPSEYLRTVVPTGVTAFNADPHEIANVAGEKGIRFMIEDAAGVPAAVRFMMPSCVPSAAEDKSGCVINAADAIAIAKREKLFGLGEMMNFPGVINCDADVMKKLEAFDIIDGHAPSVSGEPLNAYICGGITTDHECESAAEAADKVSRGMYVMLREGSQTKNLRTLVKAVNKSNLRRFLFCTDDRNVEDLFELGTIGNNIKLAVECGMPPIDALTIASLNACEAYGLKNRGAIAPGYFADFIVCDNDCGQHPERVYYHGRLVAENGKALFRTEPAKPDALFGSVRIKPTKESDFTFPYSDGMPIMRVFPNTVVTELAEAKSRDGLDLMCCIERHGASGAIGHCYVEGFGLKGGAVAQTVGHDAHNITVLGDNARDMKAAVDALGADGGLTLVKDGRLIGKLPLEIGGLMTAASAEDALATRKKLLTALSTMEYNKDIEPFMLLSFLTLIVIPEVKLNHKGLFNVSKWDYVYKK